MRNLLPCRLAKASLPLAAAMLLQATLAYAMVEPNVRTFTAGQKDKIAGVILSKSGQVIKIRSDDDAVGTVDLTDETKIQLKKSFGRKSAMNADALLPGLRVEAEGKGNEKGELEASKVLFDPTSMKASRQIDARVSPIEGRTGQLEGRAGQLEGRAGQLESKTGQLETKQGQLEDTQKQTQQEVGQVKTSADAANQGVSTTNQRISDLDRYQEKAKETVYFKVNSSNLDATEKQKLDNIIQQTQNEKGFVIEVAGFADTTGNAARNQVLSEQRANSVVRYLQQQGNIPIHRILTPAGMGTSHEAADNKTSAGRKMNRRVEVTVLVNQGVVSGSGSSSPSSSAPKTPGAPQQ
ncbi:MAG: OmpA family protein [Bryobacteraceae bacterium]